MSSPINLVEHDERRRAQLIFDAVSAADRILMGGSNGSVEELDYLTGAVAAKFVEKVFIRLQSELMRRDLQRR